MFALCHLSRGQSRRVPSFVDATSSKSIAPSPSVNFNIWKEIRTDIDGYIATTLVKILDSNRQASYLELRIETGRTHQIRRHLADKRYPVLGDKKYAGTGYEISLQQPRQMLHAYRLIFPHPRTQETIRAIAPMPSDIKRTLKQLKLANTLDRCSIR